MNMRSNSGSFVAASPHTSSWSFQSAALPPIKLKLFQHAYTVSLPIIGIQIAMKYHFNADNHALTWVVAPVTSFG